MKFYIFTGLRRRFLFRVHQSLFIHPVSCFKKDKTAVFIKKSTKTAVFTNSFCPITLCFPAVSWLQDFSLSALTAPCGPSLPSPLKQTCPSARPEAPSPRTIRVFHRQSGRRLPASYLEPSHSMAYSFDQFAGVNESSIEYLTSHMYYFRGGDSYEY